MQSLNTENMKRVSGAGNESLFDKASSLIFVIIAKPEDLSKIQDFFKPNEDAKPASMEGNKPQAKPETSITSGDKPEQHGPVVLPQMAA